MQRIVPVLLVLMCAAPARAQGVLLPNDSGAAPMALVSQEITINLEDQVAVTRVVQTFRNSASRPLEATYVFPVPKGASVKKFTMWVDGKEVPGELVEADKARQIYTDIVRRTQDPGLLEYLGNDLLRVRVFPVPAHGEQKLAVSLTSIASNDGGMNEYTYPLRADGKTQRTLEKFSLEATLRSQHPIQNIYSPSHAITTTHVSDRHAVVRFDSNRVAMDKDFQLYWTAAAKDVGLTALTHRAVRTGDGHFLLLISPRAELVSTQQVPRDVVFVIDTSGSMQGNRIVQARKALQFCLRALDRNDRFAVIHFATTVNKYRDSLQDATSENVAEAARWADGLQAVGSTNINDALLAALDMRSKEEGRCFTVVFFTDGQPTISVTNPQQILANVAARNTANTRIFTFGVGDDVNAVLLDQLADKTRAVCSYVRESEDIEAKVSGLYSKISQPVLTNLKLTVGDKVTFSETYPPQLPDLFHGSQLVVAGRYRGHGKVPVTLRGSSGMATHEIVYEVEFPEQTKDDKAFVEDLWARRKVGYLLDQIRLNGEKKEITDEVVSLAKKYGITTPYTSYLVAPDTPVVTSAPMPMLGPVPMAAPQSTDMIYSFNSGLIRGNSSGMTPPAGAAAAPGHSFSTAVTATATPPMAGRAQFAPVMTQAPTVGNGVFAQDLSSVTTGRAGVDLSQSLSELRTQSQVATKTVRKAAGRTCTEVNGVWTDEAFNGKQPLLKVKALSNAYFRLLERQPQLREVFQLGQRVIWVTPSGTALVIDPNEGVEELDDARIHVLFTKRHC